MTNAQIIFDASIALMEQGKIKGTGRYITVEDENGNKKQIELPEEIHTFNGWKERGYNVKKGAKSEIKIQIWKHTSKKIKNDETGAEEEKNSLFMKAAAFFTSDQVEKKGA